MATNQTRRNSTFDPNSGFSPHSRTFHSLRPNVPLPRPSHPISITDYALSILPAAAVTSAATAIIDTATDHRLPYPLLLRQIKSLASSLQSLTPLKKGHVALILTPPSLHVPALYLSLLSLGIVISPANPLSSPAELTHLVRLVKPQIAFATSKTADKIPKLPSGTVLLDSPEFLSMLENANSEPGRVEVSQSESAAILFSSGTTGRVKGVLLTHGNLIALIGGFCYLKHVTQQEEPETQGVLSILININVNDIIFDWFL